MTLTKKFGKARMMEIKGLMQDGCNVDEVMAYYKINLSLAHALMDCARRLK